MAGRCARRPRRLGRSHRRRIRQRRQPRQPAVRHQTDPAPPENPGPGASHPIRTSPPGHHLDPRRTRQTRRRRHRLRRHPTTLWPGYSPPSAPTQPANPTSSTRPTTTPSTPNSAHNATSDPPARAATGPSVRPSWCTTARTRRHSLTPVAVKSTNGHARAVNHFRLLAVRPSPASVPPILANRQDAAHVRSRAIVCPDGGRPTASGSRSRTPGALPSRRWATCTPTASRPPAPCVPSIRHSSEHRSSSATLTGEWSSACCRYRSPPTGAGPWPRLPPHPHPSNRWMNRPPSRRLRLRATDEESGVSFASGRGAREGQATSVRASRSMACWAWRVAIKVNIWSPRSVTSARTAAMTLMTTPCNVPQR